MASDYIAPLGLKYIFVNVFAGSFDIFTGILFIGISILAGIFKMPIEAYLIMILLSSILLYDWITGGIYPLIILILGLVVYYIISRIIKD